VTGEDLTLDGSSAGIVAGTILRGPAFEPVEGRVVWEDGEITAVEETATDSDLVVLPAFVNAHTQVGRAVPKGAGAGGGESDAAPGGESSVGESEGGADGESSVGESEGGAVDAASVAAMARTLSYMERAGTAAHLDFRAGGVAGVAAIERATADRDVRSLVLAGESAAAMERADGFGATAATDAALDRERRAAREAGKPFGVHAGEVDASDINPALDLDPDFVVHMTHADEVHLERVADSQTPVVACPRSNAVADVGLPPIPELHERTTVALGTGDVAANAPSPFRELEWTATLYDLAATDVLAMATKNAASVAGLNCGVVEPGREAKLLALDGDSDALAGARDPVSGVVHRATVDDVERVAL